MRITPFIKLAKLVLLQPSEYKWVTNIVKISQSNPKIRKEVLEWEPLKHPGKHLLNHPRILKDDHTGASLCWSMWMAQQIMKDGCKTRKHKLGHKYGF